MSAFLTLFGLVSELFVNIFDSIVAFLNGPAVL